jgi:hypothetical protein
MCDDVPWLQSDPMVLSDLTAISVFSKLLRTCTCIDRCCGYTFDATKSCRDLLNLDSEAMVIRELLFRTSRTKVSASIIRCTVFGACYAVIVSLRALSTVRCRGVGMKSAQAQTPSHHASND